MEFTKAKNIFCVVRWIRKWTSAPEIIKGLTVRRELFHKTNEQEKKTKHLLKESRQIFEKERTDERKKTLTDKIHYS
jgi:hypothetical protein